MTDKDDGNYYNYKLFKQRQNEIQGLELACTEGIKKNLQRLLECEVSLGNKSQRSPKCVEMTMTPPNKNDLIFHFRINNVQR